MRSRRPRSIVGLPTLLRDFQRQNRPVPPKDGLRLNHPRRAEQARPEPRHPDQQRPSLPRSRRRSGARLKAIGNTELMTKEQVFGYKPAPRLEQVDDEYCERKQQRKASSVIMR